MPPRHGKSELCSKYLPAWFLGTRPDQRVILTSYEADFAAQWGRKARGVLEEHGPTLFGVRVSKQSSAANRWDLEQRRGGMMTAGVGGPVTGKGADLLIIDDPIKNPAEAHSPIQRQKIYEWYQSVAYTRLSPDGGVLLIQTRWHADDLAGRIIQAARAEGEAWRVVNLPALAGEDDPLGRAAGEALWPERMDRQWIELRRQVAGTYYFNAMYQQQPNDPADCRIQRGWLRYYGYYGEHYALGGGRVVDPAGCLRFMTVDPAGTSLDVEAERRGRAPSWTVISTWDHVTGALIWRDLVRLRAEIPAVIQAIERVYRRERPAWVGVEHAGLGIAVCQELPRRHIPVRQLHPAGKDKLTRAATALNLLERGEVYLPESAPWREALEDELLTWTGHKEDPADQIDTLSYAAMEVFGQGPPVIDACPIFVPWLPRRAGW
jgi:predicted phage terminase large subunit-like protein